MTIPQAVIILCTAPNSTVAHQLADLAINRQLAACVTLLPGATSVYRWQGKIERKQEIQMVFKSSVTHQNALITLLKSFHPWDIPELLTLPVYDGDTEYLSWLHASLASS